MYIVDDTYCLNKVRFNFYISFFFLSSLFFLPIFFTSYFLQQPSFFVFFFTSEIWTNRSM